MPSERLPPTDPFEWLNRARSSLAQARARPEGVYVEDLCFNAQQAAEKALKALLLHRRVPFPYVHDLGELARLLEASGEALPECVRQATRLTEYAVEARYPGVGEPVEEDEYAQAVRMAEQVVHWVADRLQAGRGGL